VGKTVLQRQIIDELIGNRGVDPARIFYVQFDEIPSLKQYESPIIRLSEWYENTILKGDFNDFARKGKPVYLIFDEVQNLNSWAEQLKALVDHNDLKVFVTGSSSLKIEKGKDSLAGRITIYDIGPLSLREVGAIRGLGEIPSFLGGNGLAELKKQNFWDGLSEYGEKHSKFRKRAFKFLSQRGGYPLVQKESEVPWDEIADRLVETVVERVIQHDLRTGEKGRKRDPRLLEEIFRLCCRYAGQAPRPTTFSREIARTLDSNVGSQRILHYLDFLAGSLLIRLISPLEIRLKKQKRPRKIALCDLGLRSAWLHEVVPLDPQELQKNPHLADLAGHLVESLIGYYLTSIHNLDVAYYPKRDREPEVDFIITIGTQRIPIEVKYRRKVDTDDIQSIVAFISKNVYKAPFGILITQDYLPKRIDDRVVQMPLSAFLLLK